MPRISDINFIINDLGKDIWINLWINEAFRSFWKKSFMELKMVRAEEILIQLEPKYRKTMSDPWKHDDHSLPRQLSWPILLDSKALIVRNCGQVIVLLTELDLKYRIRKRYTICKGFLLRKVCLLCNKAIRTHWANGASLKSWWKEGFPKTLALSDGEAKGQGQEKKTLENIPVLECVDNLWQKEFDFCCDERGSLKTLWVCMQFSKVTGKRWGRTVTSGSQKMTVWVVWTVRIKGGTKDVEERIWTDLIMF